MYEWHNDYKAGEFIPWKKDESRYAKPVTKEPTELLLQFGKARLSLIRWERKITLDLSEKFIVYMYNWELRSHTGKVIRNASTSQLFPVMYKNWVEFFDEVNALCISHNLFTQEDYRTHRNYMVAKMKGTTNKMNYRIYTEDDLRPWHVFAKPVSDTDPMILTFGNAKLEIYDWSFVSWFHDTQSAINMYHWKLYNKKGDLVSEYKPFPLFARQYINWLAFFQDIIPICVDNHLFTKKEFSDAYFLPKKVEMPVSEPVSKENLLETLRQSILQANEHFRAEDKFNQEEQERKEQREQQEFIAEQVQKEKKHQELIEEMNSSRHPWNPWHIIGLDKDDGFILEFEHYQLYMRVWDVTKNNAPSIHIIDCELHRYWKSIYSFNGKKYDNWNDFFGDVKNQVCQNDGMFESIFWRQEKLGYYWRDDKEKKRFARFTEKLREGFSTQADVGKTSEELLKEREKIFAKHTRLHRWFDENLTVHYHQLYKDRDILIMTDELTHAKEGTTTIVARMFGDVDTIFATYKVDMRYLGRLYDVYIDSGKTADYERYCNKKSEAAQGAMDFVDLIIKQVHMLNDRML